MSTTNGLRVALGSDHTGFTLKENLKQYLTTQGYNFHDCGTYGPDSVDYPKTAYAVAIKVSQGDADIGIIVDGAGIGSAMVATKLRGVRAALCYDVSSARNAREHNNANLLTLGAGLVGPTLAEQIVFTFLTHQCTVERYLKRVKMIDDLDDKKAPILVTETKSNEDTMNEISAQDIEKISQRVRELLSVSPQLNASECGTDMICKCGIHLEKSPDTIRQFLNFGVDRIAYHAATGCDCVPEDIARCIDHTILKPDSKESDVVKLCDEAREFEFASVCVSPSYVPIAARELANSPVKVCTVVGFPSGAHMPEIKAMEARRAIRDGAREIDMVANIGALKSGNDELVYRDIRLVCEACEDGNAILKVIIETAYLTDDEKIRVCELAKKAKAHYVKTSTGFGPGGATVDDIKLMKKIVAPAGMGVKAAAGIRTYETAEEMIRAGADRIGATASVKIVQQAKGITVSN
jgi:deoxyribose-phosphate aldolase